ncbi:hypothetical protein BX600DRAFT_439034 [Xylariales sp. PMI_506]|nr:hypothetical protein BX600DRAFT_439034 [Xylariales sp. PMI_506]
MEERVSQLVKRSKPKCGPNLASNPTRGRDLGFDIIEIYCNVSDLEKRMELLKRSVGAFYRREIPRWTEAIVPHEEAEHAEEMSTAIMKSFSSLAINEQYSTGVQHLSGCTTMFIISRRGVYATHWWESVSLKPDDEWRVPPTQTDDELFQNTVIKMLISGGPYHPRLDASLIEDNYIRAYLVRPTQTYLEASKDDVVYPDKWNAIKSTVGNIIPILKDVNLWTGIPYTALNDNAAELSARSGTAGKSVFKYDPAHKVEGSTTHMAALWSGNKIEAWHNDKW